MGTEYYLECTEGCEKAVKEGMALFTPFLDSHQISLQVRCCQTGNRWQVNVSIDYHHESGERRLKTLADETTGPDSSSPKERDWLIRRLIWQGMKTVTAYDPGPWGILRGVRPIKIAHTLIDKGASPEAVIGEYMSHYGTSPAKARLAAEIALRQRPFLTPQGRKSRAVSIYIAIPYCPTRCLYCSFPANPLPADHRQLRDFLQALYLDMADAKDALARHNLTVETVYIGGGTPTSLGENDFRDMLHTVKKTFITSDTAEFTVEAGRPDSITEGKIVAMANEGVTRVSINPQSMQDRTLAVIGRRHSVQAIIDLFHQFRRYCAISINMDIIAGLPGETEQDMIDTMEKIAALGPDNLTVHTLTLKRGSALKAAGAAYPLPDDRATTAMTDIAASFAKEMGLVPYYLYRQKYMTGNLENIGYARPGRECIYNIQIMEERQTIIGIGPAAGSKMVDTAAMKLTSCYHPKEVSRYISHLPVYLAQRTTLLNDLYGETQKGGDLC